MRADTGFGGKRMLLVLVVVSLPFGVAACGGEGDNAAGTVTVTTTVAMVQRRTPLTRARSSTLSWVSRVRPITSSPSKRRGSRHGDVRRHQHG